MANSIYTNVTENIFWYLRENKLAVVAKNQTVNAGTVEETLRYETIQESLTSGILLDYEGLPVGLDPEDPDVGDKEVPVPATVQKAIVEYVLARLYQERPNKGELDVILANNHWKTFERDLHRKRGGKVKLHKPHIILPQGVGALK